MPGGSAGWLFWVVFPVLCLAAIALAVFNIVGHIGDRPTGIRGSFVVSPRTCVQGICSFGGLFTSDDGSIKNLPLLGDPRWHSQDVHHVVYDPGSVEVTALPGHWDPTPSVIAALGAVTYLGLVGSLVRSTRRDQRDTREATCTAGTNLHGTGMPPRVLAGASLAAIAVADGY